MVDTPKFLKKNINGDNASYKLERELEPSFSLHRDGSFNLSQYGDTIGFNDRLPEGVRYTDKPLRGADYVSTEGRLANVDRELERASELKKRTSDKLAKYTDHKKGEGATLKRELDGHDRALKSIGEDAQRQVHDLRKDLERHKDNMGKSYDATIDALTDHKHALHDTVGDITHGADGKLTGFDKLGDHTIETKVGSKKYTLSRDGVKVDGKLVETLEAQELKDLQHSAKEAVSSHIETHKAVVGRAHDKAVGIVDQKLSHLDNLKSKISEKSGVGEWTGKKASALTPGGANAAEKGIIGAEAYAAKSFPGKLKAAASANWKNSGTGMKFVRGLGTAAGVIAIGAGVKDMLRGVGILSPKTDETGKEVPAGAGDLVKGVGESAAGLGVVWLSLVMGGKKRATGI